MKAQKYRMKRLTQWSLWMLLVGMALLTSCVNESRGFALPDGDVATGKLVFDDMGCARCHSIADIAWIGNEKYDDPQILLGGEVTTIKTYGELVTSVINPSHKISKKHLKDQKTTLGEGVSKMEFYHYNEIMTVQQLVDLVTFLQSEYKVVKPVNVYSDQI